MTTSSTPLATLSAEQEQALITAAQGGDSRSRERLVTLCMPLVEKAARKFRGHGMDDDDLRSEGSIGLIQAVERYDARRGTPFAAFALTLIRQTIRLAVEGKGRVVNVPARKARQVGRIDRLRSLFEQEHGRQPSISEMSERAEMSEPRVKSAMTAATRQFSVEQPLSEGNRTTLLDKLASASEPATDYDLILTTLRDEIRRIVSQLTEREQTVLRAFYGIGEPERTLAEIAQRMGVKRERARQIRDKGVRHMRSRTNSSVLRSYLA